MTINFWEDNTKVVTPDGHIGRLKITRRERILGAENKLKRLAVIGSDGMVRFFELHQVKEFVSKTRFLNFLRSCNNEMIYSDGKVTVKCVDYKYGFEYEELIEDLKECDHFEIIEGE